MGNCNGNVYNIGMGCCEPVLGPIENYYTKYQVDKLISGITVSGVTEEELQDAIESAKTEIEAEIPVVPTNVSAFNNDVPYLTEHQSLSAYSTTEEMNEAISAATDNLATEDYVNTQISSQTADFVTGEELSSYTYDKATIDSKITSGGTFDPTQYYNKTATDELLAEKLDASAYTPTDLSNYYNKQEVDNKIASAKTEIEGEIPSLSGYATEQWVLDKNYITGVDLSNYSTTEQMNGAISAATSGLQPTLSAGTGIDITDNVISATGGGSTYYAGRAIDIDSGNTISFDLPISAGTGTNALIYNYTGNTASGNCSHAEGQKTQANGPYSHAEGYTTKAEVNTSHAEGAYTIASGTSSHAEGYSATTSGYASHAEGYNTQANGNYSHAEGNNSKSNGQNSHAEGSSTVASGNASHAEGQITVANGQASHAEGYNTQASGDSSHAEGQYTVANNTSEHASGKYNISLFGSYAFGESGNTLFSVGNGNDSLRHNALDIRQDGSIYIADLSGGTNYYDRPMIKLQDALPKIWCGTQSEYEQILVKDPNTLYLIHS